MSCTICQHPQRREIDQALIAESSTLTALSQEHGLSTSALHRHKAHLQAKVKRAQDQLQDTLRQGCLFWLSQALEMSMQTAQAAQAEGNYKVVLQAVQQVIRLIGIILKQDFQPDLETVYRILASPQWAAQASLLPDDPQILAAKRQALAGTLLSPCPDTPAAPQSPASLKDPDLFQENLLALAQPAAQPQTENRKLATANPLSKKWEKSGKLPGKTPPKKDNTEHYLRDSKYIQETGKNSPLCRPGVVPGQSPAANPKSGAWLDGLAARLDIASLHAIGIGRTPPETLTFAKPTISS